MTREERALKILKLFAFWGFVLAIVGFFAAYLYNYYVLFQPDEQPIAFSHRVHAGQRQIDCTYCHSGARDGDIAGIPAVEQCMACHKVIRESRDPDPEKARFYTAQIAKLHEYARKQAAIEWEKVYDLAEHVKFSHQVHTSGAGLDCRECHGNVAEMDTVRLANIQIYNVPTTMGWCVQCHLERDAPINCAVCHY